MGTQCKSPRLMQDETPLNSVSLFAEKRKGGFMENMEQEMFESPLGEFGFYRDMATESKENTSWIHFKLKPEKGIGSYRIYIDGNRFAISVCDYVVNEDFISEFDQSELLYITHYDSVAGKVIKPYQLNLKPGTWGYLGNREIYRGLCFKDVPCRAIGILIMPDYYRDYLQSRYPEEYENPRKAFASINGYVDFPEMRVLMRQLKNCQATGISARLFFESKVAECISLVIEKSNNQRSTTPARWVCSEDREHLKVVVTHIETNLSGKLAVEDLARIACMGTTKLKYTFKQVYNSNISDFIVAKRLNRAEYLLSCSDLNLKQISRSVGYKKPSSFTEVFRKNTGLLPKEYRKLAASEL